MNAKSLLTKTIVSQLRPIVAALKEYNKRIEELLEELSDGNLFRSLPIAGLCLLISPRVDVILAAKLLVAMGTDRERFSSANELQSFFGTAPYTKSSRKVSLRDDTAWTVSQCSFSFCLPQRDASRFKPNGSGFFEV